MKIIPLDQVKPYDARGHKLTSSFKLSDKDTTGADQFWVGLSHFLPGGGVEYSGEDAMNEKVYIVLNGELTVRSKTEEFTLHPMDTLYIGPHEGRSIENKTNEPVSMLVMVSY
jgi:glyoxylate utilization-related uncharacterized protein